MTDEERFRHFILMDPDDDAPRLVYADWLEEQGNPRGEFIRLQCEVARLDRADPRRFELNRRARQLINRHRADWIGALRPWITGCKFHRGFVETVTVKAHVFLDHIDELYHLAPIRQVQVDLRDASVPRDILDLLPESICREEGVLPLGEKDGLLYVAMADESDGGLFARLQLLLNRPFMPVLALRRQIIGFLERHYNRPDQELSPAIAAWSEPIVDVHEGDPGLVLPDPDQDDWEAIDHVRNLIQEAMYLSADEIHIEPDLDWVRIRHRINGQLSERGPLPRQLLGPVVSCLKLMAGLDLLERRHPQEGRIEASYFGEPVRLAVSILPGVHGPAAVVHLPPTNPEPQ